MKRKAISRNIERKLCADSLGVCGNPECRKNLFVEDEFIGERAHIVPHATTQDDSFDNLILLCPTCHTTVDKSNNSEKLRVWKQHQEENFERIRQKKFSTFQELEAYIKPLLESNKRIHENYYLNQETSTLWEKFENKILVNNKKIKMAFEKNIGLFQGTKDRDNNNYQLALEFISHVEEFEITRNGEKLREVLFPREINSVFGVQALDGRNVSSVSALQKFITILKKEQKFIKLELFSERPFVEYFEEGKNKKLFLNDDPRVKQLYWTYKCYQNSSTQLQLRDVDSLLSWLSKNNFSFEIADERDISSITLTLKNQNQYQLKMVYEYCLSEQYIRSMSPIKGSLIVNLHYYNREDGISQDARDIAKSMGVKVFTMDKFYRFCHATLS